MEYLQKIQENAAENEICCLLWWLVLRYIRFGEEVVPGWYSDRMICSRNSKL